MRIDLDPGPSYVFIYFTAMYMFLNYADISTTGDGLLTVKLVCLSSR